MIDSFRLIDWLIDWLTRALQMKLRRGQVTFTIVVVLLSWILQEPIPPGIA